MASSTTKEPVTVQTTRQMLDELDALMERMLALPIDDAEAGVVAEPPAVAATLTLLDPPGETAAPESIPAARPAAAEPEPAPSYLAPLTTTVTTASEAAREPAPLPTPVEAALPTPEPLEPLPARLRPRTDLGYQFLLWVNRGYDRGTFWLGRRGSWLRSRRGRLVLGVLGLALVAASTAWLLWDWLGRSR
jgi:hypothetical protein